MTYYENTETIIDSIFYLYEPFPSLPEHLIFQSGGARDYISAL
jgi:hypothetical protein